MCCHQSAIANCQLGNALPLYLPFFLSRWRASRVWATQWSALDPVQPQTNRVASIPPLNSGPFMHRDNARAPQLYASARYTNQTLRCLVCRMGRVEWKMASFLPNQLTPPINTLKECHPLSAACTESFLLVSKPFSLVSSRPQLALYSHCEFHSHFPL